MISKILSEYERKREEKELKERETHMWFYKVNEDNIHPLYKPFNFGENEKITANKNDEENSIQIGRKIITFGKNCQKNYLEYDDNRDRPREVKEFRPSDIMKNYIRDKRYKNNDEVFIRHQKDNNSGITFNNNEFKLFNIGDSLNFNSNTTGKVAEFETSFRKFTFIINNEFEGVLNSKLSQINSLNNASLISFLYEEIYSNLDKKPELKIYINKLPSFDIYGFDEDSFCETIINMYTLEGELSYLVNNYFDKSFRKEHNVDLTIYVLLLLYSLNKKEKNSINCCVFKVIPVNTFDLDSLTKGSILYNRQFLVASKNVDEASKYLYEENEVKNNEKSDKVGKKIIYEIYLRKEKKILSPTVCPIKKFSQFPFEDEYLLAPFNMFVVKDILPPSNSQYQIYTIVLSLEWNYYSENTELGMYDPNNVNIWKNIVLDIPRKCRLEKGKELNLEQKFERVKGIQENLQELRLQNVNSLNCNDEYLFANKVKTILENCPNLKNIDLSMNFLYSDSFDMIAEKFKDLKHLNEIVVSRNNLTSLENFCNIVKENANLKDINSPFSKLMVLNLSHNRLNSNCIRSLAKVIKYFDLQRIDLSYNKIKYEGAKALVERFNETPYLQYLDLSFNNLFSEGIMYSNIEYEFETILGKNLNLIRKLHTLKLHSCNLTSESLKLISQNFDKLSSLEVVNFSGNRIDQNGK